MKPICWAILFFCVCPVIVFSQTNYKPGYVVNLNGDTLRGFVNYQQWDNNPRTIAFKYKVNDQTPLQYSISNAKAFAINGAEYFEGYKVNLSTDVNDPEKVVGSIDTSSRTDTVFLRKISKGRYLSMYSFQDNIKSRYYVMETGEAQPVELKYHVFLNSNEIKYLYRYRNQLQYIAQKNNRYNEKLADIISNAGYREPDLLSIASLINGTDAVEFVSKSQFGYRFLMGASLVENGLQYTGDFVSNPSNTVTLQLSGGVDVLPNKEIQQLFFRLELTATIVNDKVTNVSVYNSTDPATINFNQFTGAFVPQFVYNIYNKDRLKIFIDGGVSFNVSAYSNTSVIDNESNGQTIAYNNIMKYPGFWVSIPLKAGFCLNKRMEFFVSYVPPVQLLDNAPNGALLTSYRAGINILLGSR